MRVRVRGMGSLRDRLAKLGSLSGNALDLELPDGATLADLLRHLDIAAGQVHLVMVNGSQERDSCRKLQPDDEVTLFPPVAGGAILARPQCRRSGRPQ
ncbi:MAG: molybdopterin synthase sulfur carrier subunit [Gemmataceae bacterium]